MSTLGNKGDKNQGKYKAIDINNLYKGTSVSPQKPAPASNRQHGLQSLGKVANLRRMPPPANLPSLKSENIGVIETSSTSSNPGWTKDDAPSDTATSPGAIPQKSSPLLQASSQLPDPVSVQTSDGNPNRTLSSSTTGGPVLWSNVTSGGRRPGSFLDQKSVMFQEEFPQLPFGSEEKISMPRKEDESREASHGPGLNLRPQNEGNWRDGGGRVPSQLLLSSEDLLPHTVSHGSASDSDAGLATDGSKHSAVQSPVQFRGPMPVMPVRPGMPPPPPHLGQMPFVPPSFRHPLMMPFGFRPGFPPNYPPNFLPPGMPRPPFMNPADLRFQGMYPMQGWNYPCGPGPGPTSGSGGGEEVSSDRPAIVKDKDLEEFDRLAISDDGWARNNADVDYSARLVFSDEEDTAPAEKSEKGWGDKPPYDGSSRDRRGERENEVDSRTRKDPHEGQRTVGLDQLHEASLMPSIPEAWMPINMLNQQRRPWPTEIPYDVQPPFSQPPLTQLRPPLRPPAPSDVQAHGAEPDEDEMWRQRRKQQSESMSAAIERARQRREEEERRMKEEQTAAAREKLRQLDEKLGKKDDKQDAAADKNKQSSGDVKEDGRRRSTSGCSDKPNTSSATLVGTVSRNQQPMPKSDSCPPSGVDVADSGHRGPLLSPSGSTSPRPLQQMPARLPAPPRPSAPGFWPCDPRWNTMPLPPRYMIDPRMFMMSARAQIPGMPIRMPMRQSSVTESGTEGLDQGLVSADQSALRGHWYEQNPYGIYPRGPVGLYDQLAVRGPGPHGYYGLSPHDYEQCEESCESDQRLPSSRGRLYDGYRERLDNTAAESSDSHSSLPQAWADQAHHGSEESDASSKVDSRAKLVPSQLDSSYLLKRSGDLTARDMKEFGSTDSLGSCPNMSQQEMVRGAFVEEEQSYKDKEIEHGHNRKRKENSGQKTNQDERHMRQNSSGGSSSTAAVKRTHSSASNSSAASSERKTDSPRDTRTLERFTSKDMAERIVQKSSSQELSKSNYSIVPAGLDSDVSNREDKFNVSDLKTSLPAELDALDEKLQRKSEMSKKDIVKVEDSQKTVDRPPVKRIKNGGQATQTPRHKQESVEAERTRVSVGSREFVRGGRARMRGSGRTRGRSYRDEYGGHLENRSSGVGFNGSEDEDEHDLQYNSREQNARHGAEEKKKVAVIQTSGKLQTPAGGDPDYPGNDGPSKQRSEMSQSLREGVKAQNQRNEPRAPRRNDLQSSQKKDTSINQKNSSLQKHDHAILPVHIDQECYSKADTQTPVDTRTGQRPPRNFGSRSRRNNRPQDQPRQQTTEMDAMEQAAHRNMVQQRNEGAKSVLALPSENAAQGGEGTIEPLESKRPPGSNRRRRPRPSWAKRNGTNSDAVDAGTETMENVQVHDLKQETKPVQHAASQSVQKSLKDNSRPADRFTGSEGGSNAPRTRQRREGSGRKTEHTQLHQQQSGPLSDHMASGIMQTGTTSGGNNEEWETASESSDVLRGSSHQHQQPQRRDRDRQLTDRHDAKKSFTNQRPIPSRRGSQSDQRGGESNRGTRDRGAGGNRGEPRQVNGGYEARAFPDSQVAASRPVTSSARPPSVSGSSQNGAVHNVYRLDSVVYNDPQQIQKALQGLANRCGDLDSEILAKINCRKSELKTTYGKQSVAGSNYQPQDDIGNQYSKVIKVSNNVPKEGRRRNQELPPRLARLYHSGKALPHDDWFECHYDAKKVFETADLTSIQINSDRHDSGIDLSDLPSSSCCSSPFEEFSPDQSFICLCDAEKLSLTTRALEQVLDMPLTTSGTDQKDLQLLASTINLTSVRRIWQKAEQQTSLELASVWSSLDLDHDLVHIDIDALSTAELRSVASCTDLLDSEACDDSGQSDGRQQTSTQLTSSLALSHRRTQLGGFKHSARGRALEAEHTSDEDDACAKDDIDITIANYKTDEDND